MRPLTRADLVTRELDGEFILYDPVTDRVVLINYSATVIIELCDGTRTEGEIVVEVQRLFNSKGEKLDGEVRATLAEFEANGLFVPTRSKLTE